ncbi:putative transposon-derived protein F54H12.3 [Aphis craccivora]|uniref:Putative transposon-derived protein F54H12.3 n=1 Tax=Aphis craccivora TaxID=307492 RepID=A0A6G0VZ70_APHCR|nr:putative transposon-derived protein F54H12.3 [Aphis craccivora]
MIPYSEKNKGYKYILCVIDCFTKFANALSKLLLNRTSKMLQIDNGKEFYNSTFDELMKKYGIHKYSTFSTVKACIINCMLCYGYGLRDIKVKIV